MSEPIVILPELWRTDPSRGPDDAWWASNALGLQRVWLDAHRVIEETARKWGLSPWLVLAKIESEQKGLSRLWQGEVTNQYAVLGSMPDSLWDTLAADGVEGGLPVCDEWSLYFLLGVDKPRASTKDDVGARPDGWFGPVRQVEGCCMRFGGLYAGMSYADTRLLGLPAVPYDLRGWQFPAGLVPGKPCTRGGYTITPANWMSCYSLAYMMSMPGQLALREIGLRLDPEAYDAEEAGNANGPQVNKPRDTAIGEPSDADMSSTRQVTEEVATVPDKPVIVDRKLKFPRSFQRRGQTDRIVVHHSASKNGDAKTFHQWHLGQGWNGIGYHYVICKDGTIEQGRPVWAVSANTMNHNYHTIGVNLVGNFMGQEQPTREQVASLVKLLAWLCDDWNLKPGAIIGHRDLNQTSCPGDAFYPRLPEIRALVATALGKPVSEISVPSVRFGDNDARDGGNDVVRVQAALNKHGYSLVEDGDAGKKTLAAITDFQAHNGLEPDGIVGPLTAKALGFGGAA